MRKTVILSTLAGFFGALFVIALTYVMLNNIPMVTSKTVTDITVIASGGDDDMILTKAGAVWIPLHNYKGYVIYSNNRYSINGEYAYRYCTYHKGSEIPAILVEYTYTNGKTGIEIKLKLD